MINWCHVYKRHFQILKLEIHKMKLQMGSQTGKDQLDKIQSYIDAAKNQMQILAGGHRLTENGLDKGFFF